MGEVEENGEQRLRNMGVRWYPCRAGIAGLAVLGMTLVAPRAVHSQEPLTRLTDVNGLRLQWPMQAPDGRLLGSQYDRTGNAFEIVQLDIELGTVTRLVDGVREGRYLAENSRYLVVQRRARLTMPVVLIDKASGKAVKERGIAHLIAAAYLDGNALVAIQGGAYAGTAELLVFDIPSLRVTKRTTVKGGIALLRWRDQFISVGGSTSITLFDAAWNETGTLPVPSPDPNPRVNCHLYSALTLGDLFIVQAHCTHILVFDLPTRALRHSIPTEGAFRSLAAADGILFSMPSGDFSSPDDTRAYDLATARELATLPLNGNILAGWRNRLVVGKADAVKEHPLTVYAVNGDVLRNGAWRRQNVGAAFEGARRRAAAAEIDEALRLLDAAGVRGLEAEPADAGSRPILETYGVWQSQTMNQFREGAAWLEGLQRVAPLARDGKLGLARAYYKRHVIERVPGALAQAQALVRELFPAGAETAAAPAARPGVPVDVDFGAFAGAIFPVGERIYIGRWACSRGSGGGVTVEVLDRATLKLRQSVPIVGCDGEQQDSVVDVREVDDLVFVSLQYRYESESRPNLVVLRRADLKELGRTKAGFNEVRISPTSIVLCVCGTPNFCKAIGRERWDVSAVSEESGAKVCQAAPPPAGPVFFASEKYEATNEPGWPNITVVFRRRDAPSAEIGRLTVRSGVPAWATDDPDVVIIQDGSSRGVAFVVVSLAPFRASTALVLPHGDRAAIPLLYKNLIIIGYGRDLLVYDWKRRIVVAYLREFIAGGFQNNGHGLDTNKIVRLMVDDDRLVALTFSGMNSRLVPLEPLRRAPAGAPDFFEPGPALLFENP